MSTIKQAKVTSFYLLCGNYKEISTPMLLMAGEYPAERWSDIDDNKYLTQKLNISSEILEQYKTTSGNSYPLKMR